MQSQRTILQQFGIQVKKDKDKAIVHDQRKDIDQHQEIRDKKQETELELQVFLDGSAIGNGTKHVKAGYAAVFVDHPELTISEHLHSTKAYPATNNRAEYMALIRAIEVSPPHARLKVYTDSMLLYKTVTEWISQWKRRHWKKADGSPVQNLDLVQRIDELKSTRHISIQHVRAHTGRQDFYSIWNDKADKLAKLAASAKAQHI